MEPDFSCVVIRGGKKMSLRGYLEGPHISDTLVVLCHGLVMNCSVNPILGFSRNLNDRGYDTLRFDFAGSGLSDGRLVDMTVSSEIEDLRAVLGSCRTLPYKRIVVAGHSLGGLVTVLTASANSELSDGIVLLAPAGVIESDLKSGKAAYVEFDPDNVPEEITLWDEKIGRGYILDGRSLNIYDKCSRFKGRACIIHGTEDALVPLEYARKFDEVMEGATLHVIEGGDHHFIRSKAEATEIICGFLETIDNL